MSRSGSRIDPLAVAFLLGSLTRIVTGRHSWSGLAAWSIGLLTWLLFIIWNRVRDRFPGPGYVLLAVEDPLTRSVLASAFTQAGWRISEADLAAGAHALDCIPADDRPDWLVFYYRCPGGPGREILHEVQTWPDPPYVAVVTNCPPGNPGWDEVMGLGADLVLPRPISARDLIAILTAHPRD